jgi:ankyrin repeat protein
VRVAAHCPSQVQLHARVGIVHCLARAHPAAVTGRASAKFDAASKGINAARCIFVFPAQNGSSRERCIFRQETAIKSLCVFSQDLDVKNSEGETPLSLAKKQGNDVVAKALKTFGTRPQPLAFATSSTAPGVAPVIAVNQAPADNADDFDENVEPARTCFPDYAFDRSAGSKDRVHVISQRLLEIARSLMKKCITGNAPLMRQSLLEWNSCFVQ